jgi:hypothetical protein
MPTMSEVLEKLTICYQCLQAHLNEHGGEKTKTDAILCACGLKGNCHNCGKCGHKAQSGGRAHGCGNSGNGGSGRGNVGIPIMVDVETVVDSMSRLKTPMETQA